MTRCRVSAAWQSTSMEDEADIGSILARPHGRPLQCRRLSHVCKVIQRLAFVCCCGGRQINRLSMLSSATPIGGGVDFQFQGLSRVECQSLDCPKVFAASGRTKATTATHVDKVSEPLGQYEPHKSDRRLMSYNMEQRLMRTVVRHRICVNVSRGTEPGIVTSGRHLRPRSRDLTSGICGLSGSAWPKNGSMATLVTWRNRPPTTASCRSAPVCLKSG